MTGEQIRQLPALPGSRSEELLQNPNRGLRLEVYLDVGSGRSIFQYAKVDAIEALHQEAAMYAAEKPTLAQVYFYLTDYWNKPLDADAFARMHAYFEALKALGLKALLRFAYLQAVDEFHYQPIMSAQEPSPRQIIAHLRQLSPFLAAWQGQIYALQAGIVGVWGEWDFNARDRINAAANRIDGVFGEQAVLNALLDYTPEDMFLQVRYHNVKAMNINPENQQGWRRVGYHDDFLIGDPHWWNTAGSLPGSDAWRAVAQDSLHAPMDGEMSWGRSNEMELGGALIDGWKMAKRLRDHRFSSLSLAHNYREDGAEKPYSMMQWKTEPVTPVQLMAHGLPFEPIWFQDGQGNVLPRTMYEYIRDHLGYHLVLTTCAVEKTQDGLAVTLISQNRGFAAPHGLVCHIALLDGNGTPVVQAETPANVLLPGDMRHTLRMLLPCVPEQGCQLGVKLATANNTCARFANDLQQVGAWQLLK